jgi:hypothetical protein
MYLRPSASRFELAKIDPEFENMDCQITCRITFFNLVFGLMSNSNTRLEGSGGVASSNTSAGVTTTNFNMF